MNQNHSESNNSVISVVADVPEPIYQSMKKFLDRTTTMGSNEFITAAIANLLTTIAQTQP